MSGLQLIEWAVEKCKQNGIPPTDAAILDRIRGLYSLAAPPVEIGNQRAEREGI